MLWEKEREVRIFVTQGTPLQLLSVIPDKRYVDELWQAMIVMSSFAFVGAPRESIEIWFVFQRNPINFERTYVKVILREG